MCGRFTVISEPIAIQQEFNLDASSIVWKTWKPRFNIAPSQTVAVITRDSIQFPYMMTWGLIAHWLDLSKSKSGIINARSETLLEKPTFRFPLLKNQRCLILANGFYEWQKHTSDVKLKAPYYFFLKNHKPFAFAGLFNRHISPQNQVTETCAIITCEPNQLVAQIHHRMPIMMHPDTALEWLQLDDPHQVLRYLVPFPSELMDKHPVGQWVNNPHIDDLRCIMPLTNHQTDRLTLD